VRYWDSSAIVPLLVEQEPSVAVRAAYDADREIVTWWGSSLECMSALARLEREAWLSPSAMRLAAERLDGLEQSWAEVAPSDAVRAMAARLVRVHPLRAGDALQLASALRASESHPSTLAVVTLDERLALAAEREGIRVVAPGR